MAKAKLWEPRRAKGWTAYERSGHTIVKADGEVIPAGYHEGRPATKAEIEEEQTRRTEQAETRKRIDAFNARPDRQDADSIRSTIEMMEYDDHPLDCMTPEEWRALRIKICGPRTAAQ
jgi:hypothetical protein